LAKHHLLRAGCNCSCLGDASNSCSECNECRWFWKAPMQGELAQSVTAGYAGPKLPGAGNLVPYEYTMYYILPAGVKTTHGVLRWHYMTTNSCTSKSSAPEEFWNCADVAVGDASGNFGNEVSYDNAALKNQVVENLMPRIDSGALEGVNHACPVDSQDKLKGVGRPDEYHCGAEHADGTFEFCKGASGSTDSDVQCAGVPSDSVQCLEDCGDWWYQCANGAAFVKPVPVGTKCSGNAFVVEAVCSSGASTSSSPTAAPESTTPATLTAAAGTTECGTCSACLASNGVCYQESKGFCDLYPQYTWCGSSISETAAPSSSPLSSSTSSVATTQSTTPAPTTAAPTTAALESTTPASTTAAEGLAECGSCSGCLANNGVCYQQTKSFCDLYPQYTWCGVSLVSVSSHRFLRR